MLRIAAFADLDLDVLYGILRLRSEVFVVEQECAYLDPDGRDTEPTTLHLWVTQESTVVAAARVLVEPDGVRKLGRVVVAPGHRGSGLADRLMTAAVGLLDDATAVLDAQSRLTTWYRRYGFEVCGDDFVEDGIVHTPMRRASRPELR